MLKGQNAQQPRVPAKLARALITVANEKQPPRRVKPSHAPFTRNRARVAPNDAANPLRDQTSLRCDELRRERFGK